VSLAASSFYREPPRRDFSRWLIAALAVLAVHAAIGFVWFSRQPPQPMGASVDAVLLDLPPPEPAPAPAQPQEAQPEAAPPPEVKPPEPEPPPPPPELTQPEPPPPPPPPPVEQQAVPETPVLPKPEAVIELPKPDPAVERAKQEEARRRAEEQKERRAEDKKREAEQHAKLVAEKARKEQLKREASAKAAASAQAKAAKSAASAASMGDWRSEVVAKINEAKQTLPGGGSGVALIGFTVDRGGHIGGVHVVRGSGQPSLDQEAAATVRRAGSVPAPPSGVSVPLTVPIRFSS
jgi:protein TonB